VGSKIKILISTFFKLDFRDRENKGKKKFFGIFLSYLFANSVLSLNNYIAFNRESYVLLSFSTGVFLLVFVVLNDFTNLFFTKKHIDVLGSLPLSSSDLAGGKFISAFLYLVLFGVIIALPQTVFFGLYGSSAVEILLFFTANISSLFFITGLVLILYTISLKMFSGKSNFILYVFQFIFFFYVIFTSGKASRLSVDKTDLLSLGFVKYLPQFYFASSVGKPVTLSVLILFTILLYILFYFYIRKNYLKISAIIYEQSDKKRGVKTGKSLFVKYNKLISRAVVKNSEEKASYFLTLNQLGNSKSLKLKFIPLVFLPVIVSLIAVFTDTAVIKGIGELQGNLLIMTPSISLTFLMCLKLLISATKIEDESSADTAWMYSVLPVKSPGRVKNANIKFITVNFAFPLIIVLFFILSIKLNPLSAVLNLIYIFSASLMINSLFLIFDRVFPFSLESTKYNSASKLGEILFIMLVGVGIFVVQIFIFENVIFVLFSILLFLVISKVIKRKILI
jgi:hypothetical protein